MNKYEWVLDNLCHLVCDKRHSEVVRHYLEQAIETIEEQAEYDKLAHSLRICEGACSSECKLYNIVQIDGDTCQKRLCGMAAEAIVELQAQLTAARRTIAWLAGLPEEE